MSLAALLGNNTRKSTPGKSAHKSPHKSLFKSPFKSPGENLVAAQPSGKTPDKTQGRVGTSKGNPENAPGQPSARARTAKSRPRSGRSKENKEPIAQRKLSEMRNNLREKRIEKRKLHRGYLVRLMGNLFSMLFPKEKK